MTKLFFKYGTVSCGKSIRLIVDVHQYKMTHTNNRAIVIKPAFDTRKGRDIIWSRVNDTTLKADYVIEEDGQIPIGEIITLNPSCVFVDEVQFFTPSHIQELGRLSLVIPVICYGLRVNCLGFLFEPIKVLMAIADKIEEIKTICKYCEKKATQNLKIRGDSVIELGAEDMYLPVCRSCFSKNKTF